MGTHFRRYERIVMDNRHSKILERTCHSVVFGLQTITMITYGNKRKVAVEKKKNGRAGAWISPYMTNFFWKGSEMVVI